jgi:hypothetical protein
MKITLFTANQARHNYLINLLSSVATEINVVQENRTIFPGIVPGHYPASDTTKEYFSKVTNAQKELFGNSYISVNNKKLNLLPLESGDLSRCSIEYLSDFLKSDIYVVFGSSYIKGELVDFLVNHKALNIHMGVSPYYRGTDCNFWALFDNNHHLVGATIHMLSKGLDSGPILYHALSEIRDDPFVYTMSTVKSAFHSLAERIKNESIFKLSPQIQNKSKEVRYSKTGQFNEEIVKLFLLKKIDLNFKKLDINLYKDPYILKK